MEKENLKTLNKDTLISRINTLSRGLGVTNKKLRISENLSDEHHRELQETKVSLKQSRIAHMEIKMKVEQYGANINEFQVKIEVKNKKIEALTSQLCQAKRALKEEVTFLKDVIGMFKKLVK